MEKIAFHTGLKTTYCSVLISIQQSDNQPQNLWVCNVNLPLHKTLTWLLFLYISESTCCHDNPCQDFPSCMGGSEVVGQLTELIHHETRDGISQNLESHTGTDRNTTWAVSTHARTKIVSDMSAYKARLMLSSPGARCTCHSVCIQLQTRVRALKRQQVKVGWPPKVFLTFKQCCLSLEQQL